MSTEYDYRKTYDLHMVDMHGFELMLDGKQEEDDKIIKLEAYDGKESSEEFFMTFEQARTLINKLEDLMDQGE